MKYLSVEQIVTLHRMIVEATGGSHGTRNPGAIESALAQPRMTFGGAELYATTEEKPPRWDFRSSAIIRLWTATSASVLKRWSSFWN